ncbi:hypothetical protein GCM10011390_34430 [Aureimonas endophytica]|uniref:HTH marR-type domain-containing protein n=1 Tax=Aureimonas endophytica TaxID=2027858 RepID=A0A916ZST6_9HYPH|nr:MarR family transcriptional regulator [Aureimonas endophytica]GGE12384.1 hypothetical protein GCM10011390_34430 [Aureimonas endophytica]
MSDHAVHPSGQPGEATPIVTRLVTIAKNVRVLTGLYLADTEVVNGQDQFLLLFDGRNALTNRDLSRLLSVRPSTVSKMSEILKAKGWLEKTHSSKDLRRVMVRLTDEGLAAQREVRAAWQKLEADLAKVVGSEMLTAVGELDETLMGRVARLR